MKQCDFMVDKLLVIQVQSRLGPQLVVQCMVIVHAISSISNTYETFYATFPCFKVSDEVLLKEVSK